MTLRQKIQADTVVVQASGMVTADMDGQWVMMSVESGKYYSLDPVGSRIWDLIERPRTVNALVAALLTEYKVEEEQCRTNVSDFLNEMIEKGLVAVI
jgi:hypothetical protein